MVQADGRIPIFVGVTGHRDLRDEDLDPLADVVGSVLDQVEAQYPGSPLRLLTALAEGSDRLVADEALARGWDIVVPLPMPQAIYEEQFESDASRSEFRDLLDRAELVFELPIVDEGNVDADSLDRDSLRRQYEALGFFLVRYAQILIALWDGHRTNDIGGTAHVVDLNLRAAPISPASIRTRSFEAILDPWDRGPLHHIVTPRRSGEPPNGEPYEERILYPDSPDDEQVESRSRLDATLVRVDRFNEHVLGGGDELAREADASAAMLLPDSARVSLRPEQSALLRRFSVADALATRMQRRHRVHLVTLFLLVLFALLCFEAYDNLFPESGDGRPFELVLLAAYPFALVVAFIVYQVFRRSAFQDRHLDYRALAEGLRIQLFWNLSEITREVSDHYLRKQSNELRWIHEAIRVANVYAADREIPPRGPEAAETGARETVEHWVRAQLNYYVRAAGRDATNVVRGSWIATSFYAGSIATTLVVLAVDAIARFGFEVDLLAGARPVLFMTIAVLLGLSALVRAFSEKMGYSEQALQYQRMRALFARAERAVDDGLERGDAPTVQHVLIELGEEALQENADWVLFRRSRGIEIPHG